MQSKFPDCEIKKSGNFDCIINLPFFVITKNGRLIMQSKFPDFLISQSGNFDCIINLPFFVITIFQLNFQYFFYTSRNKSSRSFTTSVSEKLKLNF